MIINSEKEFYQDEFREIISTKDADIFLWGEDLPDKKLILYAGKIKELPEYKSFSDALINCGLITADLQKGNLLKCITARMNPDNNKIYLQENTFNSNWGLLKKSIDLGIRRMMQTEGQCPIEKPEDILDFQYLVRETSDPVLRKDRIVYEQKQRSPEVIRLMSARQSALDNRKNIYFYSKDGGYVHDRSCQLLKKVSDRSFVASAEFPNGKTLCTNCARTLYIRIGCRSNNKEIPILNRIFTKYGVKTSQLQKIIENGVLEFHAKALDKMTVIGKEDTWKIVISDNGNLQLWHNNYVKTSPTERYITEGFHNQGIKKASLMVLLRYIEGYSWQKHLQAENLKKEKPADTQKETTENRTANKPEIRKGILAKIKQGLKKLFGK